jgi:hypothetical protein
MTTSTVRANDRPTPFTIKLTDDLAHAWLVDAPPGANGASAGPSPGRLLQTANTCPPHEVLTGVVLMTTRWEMDAAGSSTDASPLARRHT